MGDLCRLTDERMERLWPFFPKSHGRPRVDDRRVLSGIVFVNRDGLRWRDAPGRLRSAQDAAQPLETLGRGRWVHANDGGFGCG